MCVKKVMSSSPDFAEVHETAFQAAVRMRQRAVGSLVIVNESYAPLGILTDRDLVERVMAAAKDPLSTQLAEIMTSSPIVIGEHESTSQALAMMEENDVRRLPVIDELGRVSGVISLDDVMVELANQCKGIARLLTAESPRGIAESATSRWD